MAYASRRFEITRNVALPRAEVWELLANTDRLNQVIGLPVVDFAPLGAGSVPVREARAKFKNILPVSWKEYPFDWVKNESYSVLRVYESGPLRRVFGGIEMADETSEGSNGTRLTFFAEAVAANALGAALLPFVMKQSMEKTAKYCEEVMALRRAGKVRVLPFNRFRTPVDEAHLEPLVERLKLAPVAPDLIPNFVEYLHEADDNDVAGLRPKRLARQWDAAEDDVLRLCLHATKIGLLNLSWSEMCPNCRVSKADVASLSMLKREVHCDLCGVNFEVDFDRYVELRFTVHPRVRAASAGVYCIGAPLLTPHILAQRSLEAGGALHLKIPEQNEPLHLRVLRSNHVLNLDAGAPLEGVVYHDDGWSAASAGAPPGGTLGIHNRSGQDVTLVLERVRWDEDALTAAEVTAMREFRELFSSEVLAPGQSVGIESLTLFFSDMCDSTRLYETVGDAPAYGCVRLHFSWMFDIIGTHHGAIVKTIGDAVMAVFQSPEDALRAALEVQTRIDEFNMAHPLDENVCIKIGLHHGPAIVINSNDRLDYFGRTVNLAARIQTASTGSDIVFSQEVGSRPGVLEILRGVEHTPNSVQCNFKGIEGEHVLCRITICQK